jgi:hypothetical protein
MSQSSEALLLERLYAVLYYTATQQANQADSDEEVRIIHREANKLFTKAMKLSKVVNA